MSNEPQKTTMIEVEEIREYIAEMKVSDAKQVISVLLKICLKLESLERSIDVLSEWRETL